MFIILIPLVILVLILTILNTLGFLTGAPYAPTSHKTIQNLFKTIPLSKKGVVYDIGSGDGRILVESAKQGIKSVGYEINPFLVLFSKWRVRNIDPKFKPKIYLNNFWNQDLSKATVVFIFILPQYMSRLEKKLTKELRPKTLVIVHHGTLQNKKPIKKIEGITIYEF